MLLSNLPTKFPIPFANAAGSSYKRAISTTSLIGINDGVASLPDGFPPICFIPTTANGIPPAGQDINGILNQITAWNRWQAAGGTVPYDTTFSAAIGGYPYGAIVQSTTSGKLWMSVVDGNTTNPDTAGAGWVTASGGSQASARVTTTPGSSAVTILGSTNVSSITMGPTYNGGLITLVVVFATSMSNNRYTPIISAGAEVPNGGATASSDAHVQPGTLTANGFTIYMAGNSSGIYQDYQSDLGFAVFANP